MNTVAGVDPHLDTLAIAVVTANGDPIETVTVPNTAEGFTQARGFGDTHQVAMWVIEGSGSYGRAFTRYLTEHGHQVREAPTRITRGWRRIEGWDKTDPGDARAIARAGALTTLPVVARTPISEQLRVLVNHREALVQEQTRSLLRIRARLAELDPHLAATIGPITSTKALTRLARLQRPATPYTQTVAAIIRHEASTSRHRLTHIRQLTRTIESTLPPHGHTLIATINGIGPIGAAKLIAHTGTIERFTTDAQFAAYVGAAPIETSSGRHQRHRLNRRGNRQLNRVLDTAIKTQLAHGGPAATYINRRRTEGKTTREAIRACKRHLARRIYKTLKQQTPLT